MKVQVKREPSLGLQLEEVARGGDGRGLVLVAGVEPGGNAEASGKVRRDAPQVRFNQRNGKQQTKCAHYDMGAQG